MTFCEPTIRVKYVFLDANFVAKAKSFVASAFAPKMAFAPIAA